VAQRRVDQRRGPARELSARGVALAALARVDEGAYANLVTAEVLGSSGLDQRDRAFVTDLVHGTVRMQGALDWAWGRFVRTPPDPAVRRALRLGAYQLLIQGTAPHAAVAETVAETPAWARGFVNAVLRKVAADPRPAWPDLPTELSYPDWIVALLVRDLGEGDALAALRHMNQPPGVSVRDDGYRQDLASQWVAEAVEAGAGEVVLDLCAAPGGKATVMASGGAMVVAADVRPHRTALIARNVSDLGFGSSVQVVVADGRHAPFRAGAFDRVLLDVPCSGLGVLHRRPDARWRITAADVDELVTLQRELIGAAISLCRPGGIIVLSACTLTAAESLGHDRWLASSHPGLIAIGPPGPPWRPLGRGARLLPQDAGTDGMALFRYRRQ
jgi:16S rRNA (cytosine967-C5)-methyltransferase